MRHVRVAVPVPALDALTYNIPEEFPEPVIGARVLVPVGKRTMTGVVIDRGSAFGNRDSEEHETAEAHSASGAGSDSDESRSGVARSGSGHALKPILDLLDRDPFLPPDIVTLARWVAEYYACGLGEAISTAMPPRAWVESERYARITEGGHARLLQERGLRRKVLDRLTRDKPVRVDTLLSSIGGGYGVLAALERDGFVERTQPLKGAPSAFRTVRVAALTAQGYEDGLRLAARQREAIELLKATP